MSHAAEAFCEERLRGLSDLTASGRGMGRRTSGEVFYLWTRTARLYTNTPVLGSLRSATAFTYFTRLEKLRQFPRRATLVSSRSDGPAWGAVLTDLIKIRRKNFVPSQGRTFLNSALVLKTKTGNSPDSAVFLFYFKLINDMVKILCNFISLHQIRITLQQSMKMSVLICFEILKTHIF